jgi:peptide/nickel transport system permease protein
VLVAILAPFIANNEPIFISQDKHWSFPLFGIDPYVSLYENGEKKIVRRAAVDWREIKADVKIFTMIPYDPISSDLANYNYVSPFGEQWSNQITQNSVQVPLPLRHRHWLGTTKTGADVLSGLIHSTRLSLFIGFLTMLIASLIGIIIGAVSGFFGDDGIKLNTKRLIISVLLFVPACYYIFIFPDKTFSTGPDIDVPGYFVILKIILFIFLLLLPFSLKRTQGFRRKKEKSISLPVDSLVSRFIELFLSVPRLILIITLAAISRPSVWSLILILGFTSWTGIARMVRAEFIKLRHTGFADASNALGFGPFRKMFFHLLPNAIVPLRVGIIFGIAGAILAEAGLSFLGIGLAHDTVSWGSLLAAGREQFSAWWLVLFPGLAISILLIMLNKMADEKKSLAIEKLI